MQFISYPKRHILILCSFLMGFSYLASPASYGETQATARAQGKQENQEEKESFGKAGLSSSHSQELETATVLKGSASKIIEEDGKVQIALYTLLSSELSTVGDRVEARLLVSPEVDNPNLQALKGSRIIGRVVEVKRSRGAGRAGYVKVKFKHLVVGEQKFLVEAETSTEDFGGQEALHTIAEDIQLVGRGAFWGTYNSLRWVPVAAFATEGLSLAVGAGIGASLGIIGSLRRRGEARTIFPNERAEMELQKDLNVSDEAIREASLQQTVKDNRLLGLNIKVLKARIKEASYYERLLTLRIRVENGSEEILYPYDCLLIPADGRDPIAPDLRISGLALLNGIPKGASKEVTLKYPVPMDAQLKDFELSLLHPLNKTSLIRVAVN